MMTPSVPQLPLEAYRRLLDIARDLAATLDLESLLHRIVTAAAELSDAEAASILLYDPQRKILHFQTATNLSGALQETMQVPLEGSLAGLALRRRRPVRRQHAHADPDHYGHLDKLTHIATESLIAVPLIANGEPIGVLEAVNKRSGAFSDADEEILTVLGAQAAVAIQNARLFLQADLIAELVHEVRTPLGAILAATQLLRFPQISEAQRRQAIDAIEREARYLNELTTTFLDLAALESGRARFHRERFAVAPLVDEVLQLFAAEIEAAGLTVETAISDDLPPLEADRGKIKQVLINLVSNAIKYNRPGGKIRVAAYRENGHLVVTVSDTGVGIAPEHLKHLFEKFYRVPGSAQRATGSGLGLYICKRIVEAHHGQIRVHSKPGEGTTFIVDLPLTP